MHKQQKKIIKTSNYYRKLEIVKNCILKSNSSFWYSKRIKKADKTYYWRFIIKTPNRLLALQRNPLLVYKKHLLKRFAYRRRTAISLYNRLSDSFKHKLVYMLYIHENTKGFDVLGYLKKNRFNPKNKHYFNYYKSWKRKNRIRYKLAYLHLRAPLQGASKVRLSFYTQLLTSNYISFSNKLGLVNNTKFKRTKVKYLPSLKFILRTKNVQLRHKKKRKLFKPLFYKKINKLKKKKSLKIEKNKLNKNKLNKKKSKKIFIKKIKNSKKRILKHVPDDGVVKMYIEPEKFIKNSKKNSRKFFDNRKSTNSKSVSKNYNNDNKFFKKSDKKVHWKQNNKNRRFYKKIRKYILPKKIYLKKKRYTRLLIKAARRYYLSAVLRKNVSQTENLFSTRAKILLTKKATSVSALRLEKFFSSKKTIKPGKILYTKTKKKRSKSKYKYVRIYKRRQKIKMRMHRKKLRIKWGGEKRVLNVDFKTKKRLKKISLVFNTARNNFFLTLTKFSSFSPLKKNTLKVFSSGALNNLKTTKKRRDTKTLIRLFYKVISFLYYNKVKSISEIKIKLKFKKRQSTSSLRYAFKRFFQALKYRGINVVKLKIQLLRPHALPPRAEKRRRK